MITRLAAALPSCDHSMDGSTRMEQVLSFQAARKHLSHVPGANQFTVIMQHVTWRIIAVATTTISPRRPQSVFIDCEIGLC